MKLTCIEQVWAILENRIQKYSNNSLNNLYEALQKEWFSIPTEKLNGLINQTPDRFKLCIQENGKSIGYKLHTLNKKEQINFQNILNIDQNNDNDSDENLTPILKIPLNMKRNKNFYTIIANKLLESDQTPYMLKIEKDKFLIEDYKKIVKHHMSIQNVIRKLFKDEYTDTVQMRFRFNVEQS